MMGENEKINLRVTLEGEMARKFRAILKARGCVFHTELCRKLLDEEYNRLQMNNQEPKQGGP